MKRMSVSTTIIRLTHTNILSQLGLAAACSLYNYYKSHENPYQILQVICAASECAVKSKIHMLCMALYYGDTYIVASLIVCRV